MIKLPPINIYGPMTAGKTTLSKELADIVDGRIFSENTTTREIRELMRETRLVKNLDTAAWHAEFAVLNGLMQRNVLPRANRILDMWLEYMPEPWLNIYLNYGQPEDIVSMRKSAPDILAAKTDREKYLAACSHIEKIQERIAKHNEINILRFDSRFELDEWVKNLREKANRPGPALSSLSAALPEVPHVAEFCSICGAAAATVWHVHHGTSIMCASHLADLAGLSDDEMRLIRHHCATTHPGKAHPEWWSDKSARNLGMHGVLSYFETHHVEKRRKAQECEKYVEQDADRLRGGLHAPDAGDTNAGISEQKEAGLKEGSGGSDHREPADRKAGGSDGGAGSAPTDEPSGADSRAGARGAAPQEGGDAGGTAQSEAHEARAAGEARSHSGDDGHNLRSGVRSTVHKSAHSETPAPAGANPGAVPSRDRELRGHQVLRRYKDALRESVSSADDGNA